MEGLYPPMERVRNSLMGILLSSEVRAKELCREFHASRPGRREAVGHLGYRFEGTHLDVLLAARLGVVDLEEFLLGRVQSGGFDDLEEGLVVGVVLRGEFLDAWVVGVDGVVEGGVGRVEAVRLGP